jgi:8-oxo-dGTP pyrophosphatase MutT (NUDIX family)
MKQPAHFVPCIADFVFPAELSRDAETQLLLAARAGAARELYEETGMDLRYQLDRLEPAALRSDDTFDKYGKPTLKCELKHRLYFFLPVSDEDFWWTVR